MDRYTRENIVALSVFADRGHDEFNGVDGRTLHALARRGLVWFERYEHDLRNGYVGGLTDKGRAVLAQYEAEAEE